MVAVRILLQSFVVSAIALSFSESQDVSALVKVINKLGIDAHRNIGPSADGNIITSPLLISTALGMLYDSSQGQTAEVLRLRLGYQDTGVTDSEIHAAFMSLIERVKEISEAKENPLYVANAVFVQEGFPIPPEYENDVFMRYKATVRHVDFKNQRSSVVEEINHWVKDETENHIVKIVDDIDPSTVMEVLSAVHFEKTWKTQFNPRNMMEGVFYNKGLLSEKTTVPMMQLVEAVPYLRTAKGRIIGLPNKSNDVVLFMILPDEMDGAYNIENQIAPTEAKDMMQNVENVMLRISLPIIKLDFVTNFNLLSATEVVTKISIEFKPESPEVSGGTGEIPESRMNGEYFIDDFVVDRPFLFAVYDKKNDVVYFQGRVSQL